MDPSGGILSYVVKKIGDFILSEAALLGNNRQDLEWVQNELRMTQAFLNDVAHRLIEEDRVNAWIQEVRRLAFRAEDAVDTFYCDVHTPKFFLFRRYFRVKSLHRFGTEIAELKECIAELSRRRATYLVEIPEEGTSGNEMLLQTSRLLAAPYTEDKDVVGMDLRVKEVMNQLQLDGSKSRWVVSIVGMGGLGKTTLAKKLYNHLTRSSSRFDCTAWVVVSQKYSFSDLLREIARKVFLEHESNEEDMRAKLCKFLSSSRYLIVFDDVWGTTLWDTLGTFLPDSNNGSRIIITTRSREVARFANPRLPPYELPFLGEEESWALFSKKAFLLEDNAAYEELKKLGRQIVRRCGGLPLAIVVVGGLLSTRDRTPQEWSKVAGRIDWQETEKGNQCMKILELSYNDLPSHLKWCFLYLATLPEDSEIEAEHLMRLWMAEGFVDENSSLEERAEKYLEELVQRCLIQVAERTYNFGTVAACRVHDLLLELAILQAQKIRFLDVWRSDAEARSGGLVRRLAIFGSRWIERIDHLPLESNKIRTLVISDNNPGLFVVRDIPNSFWSSMHTNLKLLRVLQLGYICSELPGSLLEAIGEMVNLRYLSLGNLNSLPSSLGNLRHLQTLDIRHTRIRWLPKSIWKIKTLRYLYCQEFTKLPMPNASVPEDIFMNLRVLCGVRAGPWMEKILPNSIFIKKLQVSKVDNSSMSTYLAKSIMSLQALSVLSLRGECNDVVLELGTFFDSLSYLCYLHLDGFEITGSHRGRLSQKLTEVKLVKGRVHACALEMLGKLEHLNRLEFRGARFAEEEIIFKTGSFHQLHILELCNLKMRRWKVERGSMALLGELDITHCNKLEALPEGIKHIRNLRLRVDHCYHLNRGS